MFQPEGPAFTKTVGSGCGGQRELRRTERECSSSPSSERIWVQDEAGGIGKSRPGQPWQAFCIFLESRGSLWRVVNGGYGGEMIVIFQYEQVTLSDGTLDGF